MGETKEKMRSEAELWGLVYSKLVPWTARRHRLNAADAEEMVQDAIKLFLQAGGIADPGNPRALLEALGSRVNGLAIDRRRKKALRAVGLTDDGAEAEPTAPEQPALRIERDDFARKAIGALLDRVEGDELVFAIVMQIADGVEEPRDQAAALGRNIRDIYKARRRLKDHADALQKTMENW